MTDRNIQLLASRYAEAMCPEESYSEEMKEQRVTDLMIWAVDAKKVIEWLSSRYCLVEKTKVEALQEEIHGEIMRAHDDDDWPDAAHYVLDVMPRSFDKLLNPTDNDR